MRELHRSLVGVALAASLGVTLARAETATTKEGAHLRQGPSASTELLGELPPRTTLDVLGMGAAIGLFADRLLQRRRDGRQRSRLRL